jgi:hypothetical protein
MYFFHYHQILHTLVYIKYYFIVKQYLLFNVLHGTISKPGKQNSHYMGTTLS